MKEIDISKTVYELTEQYPELINIMVDLGFSEISKKPMRKSVGRVMTLEKGSKMKDIPMPTIISALKENGFEVLGYDAENAEDGEIAPASTTPTDAVSSESNGESGCAFTEPHSKIEESSKKSSLKSYLERLNQGEDLEAVRADFREEYSSVNPQEIMSAEQEMMREGTPLEEVQKLCDIHSALFHGITESENKMNVAAQIHQAIAEGEEKSAQDEYARLSQIKGHPVYTFAKENVEIERVIAQVREAVKNGTGLEESLTKLREVSIHYAKKGDLLYPVLNVRYDISGPSNVMWTVDDEIRDELAALSNAGATRDEAWKERLSAVLDRAEEMIYKETNILLPICIQNFSAEEWEGIYRDSKDYAECLGVKNEVWDCGEAKESAQAPTVCDEEIVLAGGSFTVKELEAILNTIPLEITWVDATDTNKYFNEGHKVFMRPEMAIGRKVYTCHPPKIEAMVKRIIGSFKDGTADCVPVWMEKVGKPFYVRYFAVRDKQGNYLGTMELVQDMTFAKEHFCQEK